MVERVELIAHCGCLVHTLLIHTPRTEAHPVDEDHPDEDHPDEEIFVSIWSMIAHCGCLIHTPPGPRESASVSRHMPMNTLLMLTYYAKR